MADGIDYVKTNKFVLFGHHFAAIAAAGPLLGPGPGGPVRLFAGRAVDHHRLRAGRRRARHGGALRLGAPQRPEPGQDRRKRDRQGRGHGGLRGHSLHSASSPWPASPSPWSTPCSPAPGAPSRSLPPSPSPCSWASTCTSGATATSWGASIIGVVLLFAGGPGRTLCRGQPDPGPLFTLSKNQIAVIIPIYGFVASVLPVWLLLCPRDYLSTYLKIGTIAMLALGIVFVHPELQMPADHQVYPRRRPDHPRRGLPLPVHHHCLRGHLRLPRHHRHRHHAQDDRQ